MSACEGVSGSCVSLFIILPFPTHPTKKCMWQARPQHSRLRPPPFKQWCRFLMPSTCFRFHCKVMESSELKFLNAQLILDPVNGRAGIQTSDILLCSLVPYHQRANIQGNGQLSLVCRNKKASSTFGLTSTTLWSAIFVPFNSGCLCAVIPSLKKKKKLLIFTG